MAEFLPPPAEQGTNGRCPKCNRPWDDHRYQQVLVPKDGRYVATTNEAFQCPKPIQEEAA